MSVVALLLIIFCYIANGEDSALFENARISFELSNGRIIRNRAIGNLTTIDHHGFAKAVMVKIATKTMHTLPEGAVKNLPLLKVLALPSCRIRNITERPFKNLPHLEKLYLQGNQLEVIETGIFNYLPVVELYLHRNRIAKIRSGAFDNMPKLQLIKLNNNRLSEWDRNWFRNTPNLVSLYFRRNYIEELPAEAFANIHASHKGANDEQIDTKIFLSHNRIRKIDPRAFKNLDGLQLLHLDRNKLQVIDGETFAHFTQLDGLDLSKNRLKELKKNMFGQLEKVASLDLSKNSVECLPYEIVKIVDVLNVVDNAQLDCACFRNLADRLQEEGVMNKIYMMCE